MKHIHMPRDIAKKWLTALRSGKYKQGYGRLYDGNGYCCLGVLQKEVSGNVSKIGKISAELPSRKWLTKHKISFYDHEGKKSLTPYLGSVELTADGANDRCFTFKRLAKLLKEEIVYTEQL